VITEERTATFRDPSLRGPGPSDQSVAIAVLSWSWAAVAVATATSTPARRDGWSASRWLAAHPSDASLAARLAGQLS
jgi:hypothetical protein